MDAPLDWRPGKADVRWSDGTTVRAEVVMERTTAAGPVAPGLTVRLTLRLVADGPTSAPVEVVMLDAARAAHDPRASCLIL